jgi:hypothetical protein
MNENPENSEKLWQDVIALCPMLPKDQFLAIVQRMIGRTAAAVTDYAPYAPPEESMPISCQYIPLAIQLRKMKEGSTA